MSAKRRLQVLSLLALYIDFIFVGTCVTLATFLAAQVTDFIVVGGIPAYIEAGISAALVGLARLLGLSVGKPALAYAREAAGVHRLRPNLVLGTLLTLEGLKLAVRWSLLDATLPAFGLLETTPLKVVLVLLLGALLVAAGLLLLAFSPLGKRVAAVAIGVSVVSALLSLPVMEEGLARAQAARRAAQGIEVREGEVEFLQVAFPYLSAAGLILFLVLLWLCRARDPLLTERSR